MFLRPIAIHQGYVTQDFGKTPFSQKKNKFGRYPYGISNEGKPREHSGVDFGSFGFKVPVYACMDGYVKTENHVAGYGLHVKQRNPEKALESVYGHLSKLTVGNRQWVNVGDIIGYTGSTGNSTGVHLHWGVRKLKKHGDDVWIWSVENYDDNTYGYFNPMEINANGTTYPIVINHLGGQRGFKKSELALLGGTFNKIFS